MTTTVQTDRNAQAHAVSRLSAKKIYWRHRAISLHPARRGAQSPHPGCPCRPLATIFGRDMPADVLHRVPPSAGAHGGFQIRTCGGAGTGVFRRLSFGLASAIRGDGYLWTTDATPSTRRRRLRKQDALDEVCGHLALAVRRAARATATRLGHAKSQWRAAIHQGYISCELHGCLRESTGHPRFR